LNSYYVKICIFFRLTGDMMLCYSCCFEIRNCAEIKSTARHPGAIEKCKVPTLNNTLLDNSIKTLIWTCSLAL
jgi:hypothetical protein